MSMEQETLIYVEDNDREEAKLLTKGLLNEAVRNRAYFNALGAELGLKYLALENISTSKTYNLHSVHKILEEFDISDIMLNNIHIDVRVVFDENQIFIPKSHFEYDILPDIYFVFLLAEDSSHVKFLGFFEPKLINKNNQNKDYYFIEKEKLTAPVNLKSYIESFKGNTTQTLPDDVNDTAETLMVSLVDQNASKEEIKELLQYLTKSSQLRDRFIEFGNFEILSYKAERSPEVTVPEEVAKENIIDATIDDIRPADNIPVETAASVETIDTDIQPEEGKSEPEAQPESEPAAVDELPSEDFGVESLSMEGLPAMDLSMDSISLEEAPSSGQVQSDETDKKSDNAEPNLTEGLTLAGGAAIAGAAAAAETAAENVISDTAETVSEFAADTAQDVTDMFTGASMSEVRDSLEENKSLTGDISQITDEQPAGMISDMPEQTENLSAPDILNTDLSMAFDERPAQENPQEETVSHDFVESNTDDFFADMNFSDSMPEENSGESAAMNPLEESLQLLNAEDDNSDTVDFGSVDQSFVQPQPEFTSGDDMEVLDISNVNAVPNNLDRNISETIEFNNIEQSHEKPCFNEMNGEETVPMLNMNDFSPLEPLPDNNVNPESYDMDNISITDNMMPMPKPQQPKKEFSMEPLETIDMEVLDINAGMSQPKPQPTQNPEEEEALNALSSELDTIPDFSGDMLGGEDQSEMNQNETSENEAAPEPQNQQENPVPEQPLAEQVSDEVPPLEDIEKLTVDDIVEPPASDIAEEEPAENMEAISENPVPAEKSQSDDIISDMIQEKSGESDSAEASSISESGEQSEQNKEGDNSNIKMLFDENQQEENNEIDELKDFDAGFDQIPSIYQNNQKLPVKMFAIAAVAAVLVVGGIAGFSLKNRNASLETESLAQQLPEQLPAADSEPAETSDDTSAEPVAEPESGEPAAKSEQAPSADNTDILADNTPEVQTIPAPQKEPVNVKKDDTQKKAETAQKPAATPVSYTGVSKLSWEVPDYLSYSDNIKKYLQTAGKSIKLTLSSDLLLVSEYAYSNQMKIDLKLSSDGNIKASNIVKSSGSDQIDKIVLQTVKDTLNVIKPATGEVPTPDFRLALIINF